MYFFMPYCNPNNFYGNNPIHNYFQTLNQTLFLVKKAIHAEKKQEFFYDFLISVAPTQKEKNIIDRIREDERKHNKFFRKIYTFYTGENIYLEPNKSFKKPKSYIDGIKQAKFHQLASIELYKNIITFIPNKYHKDIISKILTNELNHNYKYNCILNLHLMKYKDTTSSSKTKFTTDEALQVAKYLDTDFSKERFNLNDCRETRKFTLNELAQYDGTMGKPAYVAVNGIVYDVTNISKWRGGKHYGLTSGKNLTSEFQTCHGISSKLEKLPKVGILKE